MKGFSNKVGINNILALIGSLSAILILITFSYYKHYYSAKEVQYVYELYEITQEIEISILEAESSQRGYMLTLEEPYIKPFHNSIAKFNIQFAALKELNTKDEIFQIEERFVNKLDSLVQLKILELEKTIRLTKSGNLETGMQIIDSNLGYEYMQQFSIIHGEIQSELQLALKKNKENFDFWNFVSIGLIVISFIVLTISLYNFFVKISPVLNDLIQTKNSLQSSNTNLRDSLEELRLANIGKTKTVNKNNKLIKSLKGKNEQLDHFAYVASHDLQEPLRTVSNYVEIFQEDYEKALDDDAQMYFGFINDALDRMRNLITGLLNFSRLGTSGKKEKVDLNQSVLDVKANFSASIEAQNIIITHDRLPIVEGYRIELTQLFQNIISNGIKFRKKETSPIINISYTEEEDSFWFKISDNGIGIKEEYIHKIFDMFSRLHSTKDYEGQGIGLAFCKKIVEMHHGDIWVESTFGEGTTFNFKIQKEL